MEKIKGVTSAIIHGKRYWYARIDGKRKCFGSGAKGFKLAKKAREKFNVKEYENRELKAGLRVKRVKLANMIEMEKWYLNLPTITEQKAYERKKYACNHLTDYFNDRPLSIIDGDDIEHYRVFRRKAGVKNSTIDYELRILINMYNLAIKRRKIPFEFKPQEFFMAKETNPRRMVSVEEFKALLKHSDSDFKDLLTCAWCTGMRISEILGLTAGQIHLNENFIADGERHRLDYIYLGVMETKTKTERIIPVDSTLKTILIRRLKGLREYDIVFTGNGKPYPYQTVKSKLIASCKKSGVLYGDDKLDHKGHKKGISWHSFRVTRVTRWIQKGFSDELIRRASGHESLESYKRYANPKKHAIMMLVQDENSKRHKNSITIAVNR
jgi:integrase